jgi:hypothetical protein
LVTQLLHTLRPLPSSLPQFVYRATKRSILRDLTPHCMLTLLLTMVLCRALVRFKTAEAAERACNVDARVRTVGAEVTASWKCELVKPDKLKSLEAQFVSKQARTHASEQSNSLCAS